MKIVLTGSLGHINQPLAQQLLDKGHELTIISSQPSKQQTIEALAAKAAIGSLEDIAFLTKTFTGADIVYLMEPPVHFHDPAADTDAYWLKIARNYVQAVQQSGVTKLVHLSSIGAHTDQGVGMLAAHYRVEKILNELPSSVAIKFMRPVGFYYNMFAFIPTIKAQGAIIQNYGGDKKEPWVSPLDIASVIAEEMELPFNGRSVRYIASEEISPNDIAGILGTAIGEPGLKWLVIPDEDFQQGLLKAGFNLTIAKGLTEMNAGRRDKLYDDYYQHRPVLGSNKLIEFAKDFAHVYKESSK
jgi:uncharacterized protein YbjT (DUF2867 family)